MLLDEEGSSLFRHDTFEETSAAHLSRDQRRDRTRHRLAGFEDNRGKAQSDDDRLGQLLLSGASQQSLQCGRYARPPKAASVVMRQTQRAAAGIPTFSGSVSALCVWFGPVTTPDREPSVGERVSLFREPDAGNLPVRFDEREQETGPGQTGLRWCGESCSNEPPGDYSHCACSRLYSRYRSLRAGKANGKRKVATWPVLANCERYRNGSRIAL